MRVLLLEDDLLIGEGLATYLRSEGHVVDWVTRCAQARALQDEPFDALLVDWQLPDGSGIDWVAGLRRRGLTTPVLVLTARDRLPERVQGLDAGADDYLVKPIAPEELAARLRAVRRRSLARGEGRVRVGTVEIDLDARTASTPSGRAELTSREWALLEALASRPGRIVTKADLDRLVLGSEAEVSSNALEVHVSSLRRKLGRDVIETVRGLGYRLTPAELPR